MSQEELKRFSKDLKSDQALQDEAKASGTSPEDVTKMANAKGYDFSVEELTAAAEKSKGELSEEDLDKVAGGAVIVEAVGTTVVVEVTVVAT